MQISNDDLARILGRMEAKMDAQAASSERLEGTLASLDKKLSQRVDGHEDRIRVLEVANPKMLSETIKDHEKRIRDLEHGSAKAGMIGGIGSGVGMAVIIEFIKSKMGQ
jgi:hypothetical protein